MKADPCRFCRIYALGVLGFAALLGALMVVPVSAPRFRLGQYLADLLSTSVVRMVAPAASGSGLLLALVLWSHPLSTLELRDDLPKILRRALAVSLPGYVVAVAVALVTALGVALGLGQTWGSVRAGLAMIGWRTLCGGALFSLFDAGLIVLLAWRYGERIHAGRMSLPVKLNLVLIVSVPLRATVALVLSSLLSI